MYIYLLNLKIIFFLFKGFMTCGHHYLKDLRFWGGLRLFVCADMPKQNVFLTSLMLRTRVFQMFYACFSFVLR